MYSFFLHFHSGLRWLAFLAAILLVIRSVFGILKSTKYQNYDSILAISFVAMMHLQLLVGLILYFFLSPITSRLTFDMSNAQERFWSVEHVFVMLLAVVTAQIGRTKSKKTSTTRSKYLYQFIYFGLSLLLMILGIPWNRI